MFDKDKCAEIISKVAFEVFQSLPDDEDLVLTKYSLGKGKKRQPEPEEISPDNN